MELAHAGDDGLAGLLVVLDLEGRVLLGELLDRRAELLLVALGLRLDGHLDDRLREGHRLEDDLVAAGRTGCRRSWCPSGRSPRRCGRRWPSSTGFSLLACIWNSLPMRSLRPLVELMTSAPGVDVAGVDPDVGQLAEERVRRDLERQRRERLRRVGLAQDLDRLVADVVARSSAGRRAARAGSR